MSDPLSDAFYLGCWREAGHYLHVPGENGPRRVPYNSLTLSRHLDGGYWAPGRQLQGGARLTHEAGWTVLDVWDRTVDARPNSHSLFALRGTLDFDAALAEARRRFPHVVARIEAAGPVFLLPT